MKRTALRKPTESYRKPLTDGPMNAPSANVDVHRPEISPYVSILSGRPDRLRQNKLNRKFQYKNRKYFDVISVLHCRSKCI